MPTSLPFVQPYNTRAEAERMTQAARLKHLKACREDLAKFIGTTVRDDHGDLLRLAPMHMQWVLHLDYCWKRNLKAILLAPFGHGKSSTLAIPLIAWMLGRDPNLRIKVITNDDSGASKRVAAVKQIIESYTYQTVFPGVQRGGGWTGHALYLKRPGHAIDPSVQARGVFTTGIGARADINIFDDVVDQKNSRDSAQRQHVLSLIESTWLTRLEPDGRVLYVGTLWHLDDATHHLMQRPGWCTLIQRAREDCQGHHQEVIGAIDNAYPSIIPSAVPKVVGIP